MKEPGETVPFGGDQGPEEERMVEAIKISTVFSDPVVLKQIGDKLLDRGLISGFQIKPIFSGYVHEGKKVEENQYSLGILFDDKASEAVRGEVRNTIQSTIGEKWDVPAIEETHERVNRELLGFIQGAGEKYVVEHQKYIREKRLTLTVALSALLSISAMLGTFAKRYVDEREEKAVATERARSYQKITDLESKVSHQISELDARIAAGEPLTVAPNDMAADTDYEETGKILETIRDVQDEMRKLNKTEGK